jgi:hypothetical protein
MGQVLELPSRLDVMTWMQENRTEMGSAIRDLAEADEAHTMAKEAEEMADARLRIDLGDAGTVAWRDAKIRVATEELRFIRLLCEQQLRAAKKRVEKARDDRELIRSVNSTVNTEWRSQAMGQPG